LIRIGQIVAWGPCAGKVNGILFRMTAKTEPLHERHRCRIERRNGTTSIGSDERERMFIISRPPRAENDDYNNENSWISG